LAPLDWFGRAFVAGAVGLNAFLQKSVLLRLGVSLGVVALAIFGSAVLMPRVDYLPSGNRNLIGGMPIPPSGYNLDELESLGERVEQVFLPYWDVDPGSEEAAKLDFPVIEDFFFVVRGRSVFVGLRAHDPTGAGKLVPLANRAMQGRPGTIGFAQQRGLFERGLSGGAKVDIEIVGPEIETLVRLGGEIFGVIQQINQERNKGIDDPKKMSIINAMPVPSLD